jgi:hypothetical protein
MAVQFVDSISPSLSDRCYSATRTQVRLPSSQSDVELQVHGLLVAFINAPIEHSGMDLTKGAFIRPGKSRR